MFVKSVSLKNYRNIKEAEIKPSEGVNVIYGENAQGKTNLLEAIWMFSGFHSFRTTKDAELVAFNEQFSRLDITYADEKRDYDACMKITNRRMAELNGIKLKSPSQLIGNFSAVIFAPDFMSIVKEGPQYRRDFIDTAVCQLTPAYTQTVKDFKRALDQRNSILRNSDVINYTLLDCIDEEMATLGERLIKLRKRYIEVISPYTDDIYSGLSSGREKISLEYVQKHNEDGKASLIDLLKKNRQNDIYACTSTVGPHRDDIEIKINGMPARLYGSQGQQRSCSIALKLSESAVIAEKTGKKPVVLLDDVMSELDLSRQDYILNHIGDRQVFITCCEPDTVLRLASGRCFYVENGIVSEKDKVTE